jgi:hypothetical protein
LDKAVISITRYQAEHHAVPVNLKDKEEFHLTIEEYLQALISLVEELVCCPFTLSLQLH